ncbi:MAG: DNA mismatch repair endonuclease MutL [Dehalococcoidia bacterium]|nr:DNA mismatch repair endonuclease MutL [Dehalococcoidia bacterium]
MPIRKLPGDVAKRIAAGEVVERPASIVKELVENAVDAGARRIGIEIEGGGVALIRVRDDGGGIAREDLALAFERHATSKLTTAEDLWAIRTLGFRGEALPSIAAASGEVEMTSRPPDELAGARVVLRDGAVAAQGDHGSAAGTTVTVREVFANQPARRAFLRSATSETRAILNVVTNAALARPDVAFALTADGRVAFRSGGGGLRDAAVAAYGAAVARDLLEAGGEAGDVRVEGLVSAPSQHRAARSGMVLVVNGRPITSRTLTYAIEKAYQGLLPRGRHPLAVLTIALPPEAVDVNVHPTKTEVRFRDERVVFAAVQRAVRDALLSAAPSAATSIRLPDPGPAMTVAAQPAFHLPARAETRTLLERLGQERDRSRRTPEPAASAAATAAFPPLRALGQIRDTYIIAEGPEGMYLIDQHAAHERVLFESFRTWLGERRPEVQLLLSPLTLDLAPRQSLALERDADELASLGFDIEPFGEGGVIVRAVPEALVRRGAPERAVLDLLDGLAEDRPTEEGNRAAATLACHASVRAGMTLAAEEQRALIRQLEAAAQPRTCPHGRPTMIHLSAEALERGFGRR